MKRPISLLLCAAGVVLLLAGCLATRVEKSGGPGSLTVPNTNPHAIFHAARAVFAEYGYSPGPGNFPHSISFERRAGTAGHIAFGSPMQTTSFRVRIELVPIPGTNDIRLRTQVDRVNNANVAGFESSTRMLSLWAGQFTPLMREVQARASGAGTRR